jgi:hypothetical protein
MAGTRKKATSTTEPAASQTKAAPEARSESGLTKREAVRRVLEQHGKKTMPPDICKYVKEQYGLDLTVAHASNIKSTLGKKRRGRRRGGRRLAAGKAQAESPAESTAVAKSSNSKGQGGLSVQDVETVKALVRRVDAGALHSLIDVLKK